MKCKVILSAATAVTCIWTGGHVPDLRIAASDLHTFPDETRAINITQGLRATCTGDTTLHSAVSRFVIRLQLTGHCLFEVAHDTSRLIKLSTPMTDIDDIGTVFDVETKANETIVTTLEGGLQLSSPGRHPVDMGAVRADEQAAIVRRNGILSSEIHRIPPKDQLRLSLLRAGLMQVNGTVADTVEAFNHNNHWHKLRIDDPEIAARGFTNVFEIQNANKLVGQLRARSPELESVDVSEGGVTTTILFEERQ
jgi:ferric-dicitrate binding protein FerR (iron transport regulator)